MVKFSLGILCIIIHDTSRHTVDETSLRYASCRANDFPSQPWQKLLQPLTPQWTHPATPCTTHLNGEELNQESSNGLSIKRAKLYKTLPATSASSGFENLMISCDFPPPGHYSHYSHYSDDLQAGPSHRSPLGGHIGRICTCFGSIELQLRPRHHQCLS